MLFFSSGGEYDPSIAWSSRLLLAEERVAVEVELALFRERVVGCRLTEGDDTC